VAIDRAAVIREALGPLVGRRLVQARVFLDATWHFYFDTEHHTYIAVECPWRIRNAESILIGCEDFDCLDGGGADRRVQVIETLIGTADTLVVSVDGDAVGGFQVAFASGHVFETFPASDHEMEWLIRADAGSLVLMNGSLHRTGASD
jgi:hypothetical protein